MNFLQGIFLVSLVLTFFLLWYVTRNFNYWKDRSIPYVKPIPIFGNAFNLVMQRTSLGELLHNIYQERKSPYMGFFLFGKPCLLLRNPDIIKSILIKDFENFCDRNVVDNHRDDKISTTTLFVVKNPLWKCLRSLSTPLFSPGKLRNMLPLMQDVSDQLVNYLSNLPGDIKLVESEELCGKYSADLIASCGFGINSYSFECENSAFRVAARRLFGVKFTRAVQMGCYFFAHFLVKPFRMKLFDPEVVDFLKGVVLQAVNERNKVNIARGDLIDFLIQIRKRETDLDFVLDDDILVAQAVTFFAAGYETMHTTILMTLYELSLNLRVQDRLRQEIVATAKRHGAVSYEAIQSMTYLHMVVSEALRKYPPLPYLDRLCNKDYQVPGTDIVIEKGISVYISLLGLQRDPEYFPDPDVFDPERFSEETKRNETSIPTCCNMPFGNGPRSCLGTKLGLLGAKMAIIGILTRYQVEPAKDTPVFIVFQANRLTLAPNGHLNLIYKPVTQEVTEGTI